MQTNSSSPAALSLVRSVARHLNGGTLLMLTAVLALVVANSPWSGAYFNFWQQPVHLQIGTFNVFNHGGQPLTLLEFINDALMVVFFFSTGMEIKREMLVGELSTLRQALLPVIAACGGMLMPVLIFAYIAYGTPGEVGMAIPMATDIAFSLGVLALFGKRVPLNLRVFLTTFAVADDIGGILVIALFYSTHLALEYLLWSALILVILIVGNRKGVHSRWFYIGFGLIMWYLFLQSGVHATIAGVIIAFTIPATPQEETGTFAQRLRTALQGFRISPKEDIMLDDAQVDALKQVGKASSRAVSPLQQLDLRLQGVVNYVILPLFAFSNAGVTVLKADGSVEFGVVSLGVILGLFIGKFVGIYSFTALCVFTRLSKLPSGMTFRNLMGVSMLGGVGFTVSLFIAQLSFGNAPELLAQAKIGVVCGTIISGIVGCIILHFVLPKKAEVAAESAAA